MIKTTLKIALSQRKLNGFISLISIRRKTSNSIYQSSKILENINVLPKSQSSKLALVSLSPKSWETAVYELPEIKYFNITGFTYELVHALNRCGFDVDIIDYKEKDFLPTKKYDLFIGHGGNCRTIIESLPENTPVFQYVSGAYWKSLNSESVERYERFFRRNNIVKDDYDFKRSLKGLIEGEEYLTNKADVLFCGHCPRMIEGYGEYKNKFIYSGWTSYPLNHMNVDIKLKNYSKGLKKFIYVGGTGGNIQKGLDLLLEVFAKRKDLNLYIYCAVEDEILKYYKSELNLKNIHYIYHWRFKPFHRKLRNLLLNTNFSVHAPVNFGIGTAFLGTLALGLIPVGYVDIISDDQQNILTDSWDVDSLVECIDDASRKSPEWCVNATQNTIKLFENRWSLTYFRNNLDHLFTNIFNDIKKIKIEET